MTKGIRKRLKLIKIDRKEIIDAINNGCINWGSRPYLVNSNWFFDSKTDVSFKLSQEANDSIVTFIHQHPEASINYDGDVEHYGQGDVCVWLEVNRRSVFDCDNSDFAQMPVPFQNIIRLFANKHVRGRDLLKVVDKAK